MDKNHEPVEIRLLGSLRVRRGDSSVVDASEWRTGKTLDLLRILALDADQPVRIDNLLEKLWPDVDEARGRASLRTAASQIRRTLRTDCIARRLGGLVLTNAWVDVTAFRDLAVEARVSRRSGDHARVVGLTREAEALYLGDFEAHDGGSGWAVETRESLAAMRRSLLTDAGESAVELSWMRDGVDLAESAVTADPYSERAYRALMSAFAGLGETDSALRVFNDLHTVLADELGVAPSRQTTALQMSILSAPDSDDVVPAWVGRDEDCSGVGELIRKSVNARRLGLVCVVGEAGSGREALIDESMHRVQVAGAHVHGQRPSDLPSGAELECAARRAPVAVLPPLDGHDDKDIADLVNAIAALDSTTELTLVVPVAATNRDPFLMELEMVGIQAESLQTHTLDPAELAEIAESVLCGHAAPRLVDVLVEQTGGRAGAAVSTLRRWLSEGQVVWTLSGLDLAATPAGDATNPELGAVIHGILERVAPLAMDVIQLVALVNRPVTAGTLLQLLDSQVWSEVTTQQVAESLDRLTDLGALRLGRAGYEFRHPIMRAATEAWVRPAARRRLHDRIARSTVVHESDRAAHWMQAAEPLQACDAAISSAREAQLKGDHSASRAHLAHGRDYADALSSTPEEQVAVLRQLSEVARSIGDHGLAEDAEVTALDMALSTGLPPVPQNLVSALSDVSAEDVTSSLDLKAWTNMLEDAIKRAIEPLLLGANLAIALSVTPAVAAVPDHAKRAV
jgi:DNA-binding SARP family transcriptional activator